VLRWGALGGASVALGPLPACAGPTGTPDPGTLNLTLGLNRSLVSLDNKLNQFEAAVTVQRAVRQALTRIGPDLKRAEPYTRELLAAVPRVGTWDEDSDGRTEPVAEEAAS
jgi:hypothetical protein